MLGVRAPTILSAFTFEGCLLVKVILLAVEFVLSCLSMINPSRIGRLRTLKKMSQELKPVSFILRITMKVGPSGIDFFILLAVASGLDASTPLPLVHLSFLNFSSLF